MEKSMTALISAYARAYHYKSRRVGRIFSDSVAPKLFTQQEYNAIGENMAKGISFFNPDFKGNEAESLRWIVDNQLSPSPLGRAAFAENALKVAVQIGATQYLIFAAGYDTFAYRQPYWAKNLDIFELDLPETAADKLSRLKMAGITPKENVHYIAADLTEKAWLEAIAAEGFDKNKISFCSLLGISYYLSEEDFKALVASIGSILPEGSSVVFDYPDQMSYTDLAGERAKKQNMLANAAGEAMQASYTYAQMEKLLSGCGFRIYEFLTPDEITQQYFAQHNEIHTEMSAFDNVNYCLAVKK